TKYFLEHGGHVLLYIKGDLQVGCRLNVTLEIPLLSLDLAERHGKFSRVRDHSPIGEVKTDIGILVSQHKTPTRCFPMFIHAEEPRRAHKPREDRSLPECVRSVD